MSKFIKLASLFALILGLAASCTKKPGNDTETLVAPTGLSVGALTAISAELSWTAVNGAQGYNVSIDNGDAVAVTEASYNVTELTPETAYTWKVQAVKGEIVSEWSAGPGFTTTARTPTPAPTDLTVGDVAATVATLSWHPNWKANTVNWREMPMISENSAIIGIVRAAFADPDGI